MFHYCSGIFIILFLWEHIFFLPFRFVSSPRVYTLFTAPSPEFSCKCSVFCTRILWLSNTVLRHKTLKQCWKRQRDGTDKQGHKALEEWGGERWRQTRESVCVCFAQPTYFRVMTKHFFLLFKIISKSHRKCVFGFQSTHGVKCTCSAQFFSGLTWWAASHMLNSLQQLCSICSCLTDGGYAFLGPITV